MDEVVEHRAKHRPQALAASSDFLGEAAVIRDDGNRRLEVARERGRDAFEPRERLFEQVEQRLLGV